MLNRVRNYPFIILVFLCGATVLMFQNCGEGFMAGQIENALKLNNLKYSDEYRYVVEKGARGGNTPYVYEDLLDIDSDQVRFSNKFAMNQLILYTDTITNEGDLAAQLSAFNLKFSFESVEYIADKVFLLIFSASKVEELQGAMDELITTGLFETVTLSADFSANVLDSSSEQLQNKIGNDLFTYQGAYVPQTDESAFWGIKNMGAIKAWDNITDCENVTVAVLEKGFDLSHEDFPNLWTNSSEIPNNGVDDDHNLFVDDVHGISTYWRRGARNDEYSGLTMGHGTHTAGLIGAKGNNQLGISGICWNAKIMLLVTDFTAPAMIRAISYAAKNGANIINMSIGASFPSELKTASHKKQQEHSWEKRSDWEKIASLTNVNKMAWVVAAGNEGTDNDVFPSYPAALDKDHDFIISVGNIRSGDRRSTTSNYGEATTTIFAPGHGIWLLKPEDDQPKGEKYRLGGGTSFSAPYVSGALALYQSYRLSKGEPLATAAELKTRLSETGRIIPGFDNLSRESKTLDIENLLLYSKDETNDEPAEDNCNANWDYKTKVYKRGRTLKYRSEFHIVASDNTIVSQLVEEVISVSEDNIEVKTTTIGKDFITDKDIIRSETVKYNKAEMLEQCKSAKDQELDLNAVVEEMGIVDITVIAGDFSTKHAKVTYTPKGPAVYPYSMHIMNSWGDNESPDDPKLILSETKFYESEKAGDSLKLTVSMRIELIEVIP